VAAGRWGNEGLISAPRRLPRLLERLFSSRALHTGGFFYSAAYIARLLEMLLHISLVDMNQPLVKSMPACSLCATSSKHHFVPVIISHIGLYIVQENHLVASERLRLLIFTNSLAVSWILGTKVDFMKCISKTCLLLRLSCPQNKHIQWQPKNAVKHVALINHVSQIQAKN
jgi:hypothetical protein